MAHDTLRGLAPRYALQTCEGLEIRQLLSASLDDGVLLVSGTEGADDIRIEDQGGQIVVSVNDDVSTFEADELDHIAVKAGAGDDMVDLSALEIGVLVAAMAGDDTVVGGSGADSIGGNGGEDLLKGGAGDDLISGCANNDTVMGGSGDDNLVGNQGLDLIYGNSGDDFIRARRGSDTVFGGKGDDELHGGWADDTVKGNDGDDDLTGGPQMDVLQQGDQTKPVRRVRRAEIGRPWWKGLVECSG